MILDDFLVYDANGLYCRYGDFYLDPHQPVQTAVISHAHADHAVAGNRNVYCTQATAAFMQFRYGKTAAGRFISMDWQQPVNIGGVEVSLIPAGHMLGSAQVVMVYQGSTYLYTGDYKLQPDPTCELIEWIKADVFITESTFAHPGTSHPDPIAEITKLNDIGINILMGAYSLGKAQRLIRMISDYAPQKKVLVHHRIMPINAVYQKFGINLGPHQMYNRKLMKEQNQYVYLVPPLTFDSYLHATGVKRLFASGWKNLQANAQDTLYLSDHADWNDILYAVDQVSPQQIWTLHGDGTHLKNYFSDRILVKILNGSTGKRY